MPKSRKTPPRLLPAVHIPEKEISERAILISTSAGREKKKEPEKVDKKPTSNISASFMTRSPPRSPPTSSTNVSGAPPKMTNAEKNVALNACAARLEKSSQAFKEIFKGAILSPTDADSVKLAIMTITKMLDDAIRGNSVPSSAVMATWGSNAIHMSLELFEPMLMSGAVHIKGLPMRPMDFVQADFPKLDKTVNLIVAEAKKQGERCRKVAEELQRKEVAKSPLGSLIGKMYVSEGLRGAAEKSWSGVITRSDEIVAGGDAKKGGSSKKRADGKSESCAVC